MSRVALGFMTLETFWNPKEWRAFAYHVLPCPRPSSFYTLIHVSNHFFTDWCLKSFGLAW